VFVFIVVVMTGLELNEEMKMKGDHTIYTYVLHVCFVVVFLLSWMVICVI